MEGMKYFYELFEALPRGGPGDSESTRKAFNSIRAEAFTKILIKTSGITTCYNCNW